MSNLKNKELISKPKSKTYKVARNVHCGKNQQENPQQKKRSIGNNFNKTLIQLVAGY